MHKEYYFTLESTQEGTPLHNEIPSAFIYPTMGKIIATNEDENEQVAGEFKVIYFNICAARNAYISAFDLFDQRAETIDYYSAIFDRKTEYFSDQLLKLFKGDLPWGNVLILERLEILPQFRAKNLGLITMRRLIEQFGTGAELIAIKPFPLQCEADAKENVEWWQCMKLANLPQSVRTATAKLRRYYIRLGFKAMPGTPFMFQSSQMRLPYLDLLDSAVSADSNAD